MNDLARTNVRSHAEIRNKRHVAGTTYGVEIAPVTAQAGIPAAKTVPVTPMAWKASAKASPTFVPELFHTFALSASIAALPLTVGRPKQLMMALQTLFVVMFLFIVEPPAAKTEPVVERTSFLYLLIISAIARSILRSIRETCARIYLSRFSGQFALGTYRGIYLRLRWRTRRGSCPCRNTGR